jgi:two-component system, chemotaxis family, CheB/CheR fusion protein
MDLLALAREGLRLTVRSAVRKVIEDSEPVTLRAAFKRGSSDTVLVTADPVRDGTESGMILVSFAKDQVAVSSRPLREADVDPVPGRDL